MIEDKGFLVSAAQIATVEARFVPPPHVLLRPLSPPSPPTCSTSLHSNSYPIFSRPSPAGQVLTDRHNTILNLLNGAPGIPSAFDMVLSPQQVLSVAAPFISGGCDPVASLGLTRKSCRSFCLSPLSRDRPPSEAYAVAQRPQH